MKIIVDAMGGDNAPLEIVRGALNAHKECGADILLVDDRICDDWGILYEICRTVEPSRLLIVSNGYSEYGESFSGIPVTLVDWEGIRFRFVR